MSDWEPRDMKRTIVVYLDLYNYYAHLNYIQRTSLRIPVTMDNDTIITFVYKVCTPTDVVQIWRITSPILQLEKQV